MNYNIKFDIKHMNRMLIAFIAVVTVSMFLSLIFTGSDPDVNYANFHLFPIGYSYWFGADKIRYSHLFEYEVKIFVLIFFSLYCFTSAAIGNFLIGRYVNGAVEMAPAPRFMAGFIPGYLIIVAVNRIITYFLPNQEAVWVLLAIYIVTMSAIMFGAIKKRIYHPSPQSRHIISTVVCVLMAGFFLCLQVQVGYFHVFPDGASMFLELIKKGDVFDPSYMFPLFSQHYDEIMFIYPIVQIYDRMERFNPIEIYWILYSLGKFSALCAVYLCVERMTKSWVPAVISVALIFFGGIHPNPFSKFLTFDSDNPIAVCAHIGRVFLAISPVLAAYFIIEKFKKPCPNPILAVVALLLLGIGYSSLTASSLFIIIFSALLFIGIKVPVTYRAVVGIVSVCCFAVVASYFQGTDNNIGIWVLPLSFIVILVMFCVSGIKNIPSVRFNIREMLLETRFTAIFLFGLAVGLFFLGNLLVVKSYLFTGLPHSEIITRGILPASLKVGGNRLCAIYAETHCCNFYNFFSYFGLPFILSIIVLVFALLRNGRVGVSKTVEPMVMLMMCSLVGVVVALFFYDFMNGGATVSNDIWIKSRLVEPWFYATLVFIMCNLWLIGGAGRDVMVCIGIVYVIFHNMSFSSLGFIGTFARNAEYILYKLLQ